jgi:hypothetical protein
MSRDALRSANLPHACRGSRALLPRMLGALAARRRAHATNVTASRTNVGTPRISAELRRRLRHWSRTARSTPSKACGGCAGVPGFRVAVFGVPCCGVRRSAFGVRRCQVFRVRYSVFGIRYSVFRCCRVRCPAFFVPCSLFRVLCSVFCVFCVFRVFCVFCVFCGSVFGG